MNQDERAKYLIELVGYKKALKMTKEARKISGNNNSSWHHWNSIIYKIKRLNNEVKRLH